MADGPEQFQASLDITAPQGAFSYGFQLALQNHLVPIFATSTGLHAESPLLIPNTTDPKDRKIAIYFDGQGQNGIEIKFALSLTPTDSAGKPTGPALVWSLTWTTSMSTPARLKGFVPFSSFKAPEAKSPDSKETAAKGGA